jgi:hypothetical protein
LILKSYGVTTGTFKLKSKQRPLVKTLMQTKVSLPFINLENVENNDTLNVQKSSGDRTDSDSLFRPEAMNTYNNPES